MYKRIGGIRVGHRGYNEMNEASRCGCHENKEVSHCGCNESNQDSYDEETIVDPAETVVNTTTNHHLIKHVHPTRVINVNRDVYRIEHYYPITECDEHEKYVQEYDCGCDLKKPQCKPKHKCNQCEND